MGPPGRSHVRWLVPSVIALAVMGTVSQPTAHSQELRLSEYETLGNLDGVPGDEIQDESFVWDVSADGSVLVGNLLEADAEDVVAFSWSRAGGFVLPDPIEQTCCVSYAQAVSADGRIVVGASHSPRSGPERFEAFSWTSAGGTIALGDLPGGQFDSSAAGVSDDGRVIVGFSESGQGVEACRWVDGSGPEGLGDLPGGDFWSAATGVSADGAVIVGSATPDTATEAFRWTEAEGLVPLGGSIAWSCSADGRVIVGSSGERPVRWVDGVIEELRDHDGARINGVALDCSADGSVIVGVRSNHAFVWTVADGARSLWSILNERGIDDVPLSGLWGPSFATAVSADGRVVCGTVMRSDGRTAGYRALIGDELPVPEAPPLLITKARLKPNEARPHKSQFSFEAYLDPGPGGVDPDAPCAVRVDRLLIEIPAFRKRKGGWRYADKGVKVDVFPSRTGSSLVRLKVRWKGDLGGRVYTGGSFRVRSTIGGGSHAAYVHLFKHRYKPGKKGLLESPGLCLRSVNARLRGGRVRSLKLVAGLGGRKPVWKADIHVTVAVGDWEVQIPGDEFKYGSLDRDYWAFRGNIQGITSIELDYTADRMTVEATDPAMGAFPTGTHTVPVRLAVDDVRYDVSYEATVRMVSKRGRLRY